MHSVGKFEIAYSMVLPSPVTVAGEGIERPFMHVSSTLAGSENYLRILNFQKDNLKLPIQSTSIACYIENFNWRKSN
jgi:hypothetical protein